MHKTFLKFFFISFIVLAFGRCNNSPQKNQENFVENEMVEPGKSSGKTGIKRAFPPRKNNFERAVDTLVLLSIEERVPEIAAKMLFSGEDASRKWKDVYHQADGSDYEIVRITANVISDWSKKADRYTFGKLTELDHESGKWQVQEVIFISKENIHRKEFSWMIKDGKYFLTNISNKTKPS